MADVATVYVLLLLLSSWICYELHISYGLCKHHSFAYAVVLASLFLHLSPAVLHWYGYWDETPQTQINP